MATKLLCLLLVTACTAELGFRPKQQYKYTYEAQQASGIPEIESQWSALGLNMTVIIQALTQDNLYFQLKDVEYGEVHNENTKRPWQEHINIPYQPVPQFKKYLTEPFKVQMRHGVVETITTSSQEPTWVVNIKKSIAQLFQLDMQRQQSIQEPTMPQPTSYLGGKREELVTMFRVMEGGIGGECETIYEVSPSLQFDIDADTVNEMSQLQQSAANISDLRWSLPFNVTKTKNYQNCRTRPIWQHMTPPAQACSTADCHLTASNSSATVQYVFDGNYPDFQIQAVLAQSEALVYPFGYETEQLWTVTKQALFLEKSEKMGHFIGEPQQPITYHSLAFEYPTADGQHLRFPDLYSEPQISTVMPGVPIQLIKQKFGPQKLIQRIVELIQKVDSMMVLVPQPEGQDVASLVIEIERAFSLLSYQEIKQVYQKMQTDTQTGVFIDTLSSVGTNPAVSFMIGMITRSKITQAQASSIISTLPLTIKTPTPELITKLVQTLKTSQIQKQQSLRMTMSLAVANIFHQVCISNVTVDFSYSSTLYAQPFCTERMQSLLKQDMIPFLEQQIERYQEPEKLVYIQALGNVGHKSIIKILSKIFTSHKTAPQTASKAIYALHYVVRQYPETVRNLVLPIWSDSTNNIEVRVAALVTLLASNPPITYWQRIAVSTWFEPSYQMISFIHSAFSSLASNTNAQVTHVFEMSRRAHSTRYLIRPLRTQGMAYSRGYSYISKLIHKYQLAAISRIGYVYSPESVVPNEFYTEFQHYVNSLLYGTSKVVANVKGVESLVEKMLKPYGSARSVSEILRNITSDLKIDSTSSEHDFHASVYVQLMGAIDRFFIVHYEQASKILGIVGTRNSFKTHHQQKIMYLEDKTATFPSEIGFPVTYVKKVPLVASVRGEMSASSDFFKQTVEARFTIIQPFVASKSRVMVSTVNPWSLRMLGVGVENNFQLGLPFSAQFKFNGQERTIQVQASLLRQPSAFRLAHVRTMPFTTAIQVDTFDSLVNDNDTKEILVAAWPQERYAVQFGKSIGISGKVTIVSDLPVFNFGTVYNQALRNGSPRAQLSFWYMVSSLHSRHYDVVIDTAKSQTQSVLATFAYTDRTTSSRPVRQSIIQSPQHLEQLQYIIGSARSSLQRSNHNDYSIGVSCAVTFKDKSGKEIHSSSYFVFEADPELYETRFASYWNFPDKKVCLEAYLPFPRLSESRQSLLSSQVRVPLNGSLGFGTTCQQHKIEMTGSAERDQEQLQFARESPQARRCELHESRGNPNSADCRIAKDQAATVNIVNMNFTWNNLPTPFKNRTCQLDDFVKYLFWPFMSNDPYSINKYKTVTLYTRYSSLYNYLTLHVRKPFETTTFDRISLPFRLVEPYMFTLRKSVSQKIADAFYGVDKTTCISDRSVLKTFDNVTISRDTSSECWTLLSKDASGTMNLAILDKLISGRPAVRVLADQSDVQVTFKDSNFEVLVDGQNRPISPQQSVKVLSPEHSTLMYIQQIASDHVLVQLPQHYARVLLTKEGVQVYMSQLVYRNKLTGVCSSMDGEVHNELVGPSGCVYRHAEDFVKSFVVPLIGSPEQCMPQKAPPQCERKPHNQW